MILLDIKKYIIDHKRVSMQQLSKSFNMDADALRPILQVCMRKGQVRLCSKLDGCAKCNRCSPLMTEIYESVSNINLNQAPRRFTAE